MSEVVDRYLRECANRRIEPYYGFIKHVRSGAIDCDLDFVQPPTLRLIASVMSGIHQVDISGGDHQLTVFRLTSGYRRSMQHPPVKSSTRVSYTRLLQSHKKESGGTEPLLTSLDRLSALPVQQNQQLLVRLSTGIANVVRLYSPAMSVLHLQGVPLGEDGARRLADVLPACCNLRVLDLAHTRVGDAGFEHLLRDTAQSGGGMVASPLLSEVSFAGCGLTDISAGRIKLLIASNKSKAVEHDWATSLRRNNLGGTDSDEVKLEDYFRDGGVSSSPVADAAGNAQRGIRTLDLSHNYLSDETALAILASLVGDKSLVSVNIADNSITARGIAQMLFPASAGGEDVLVGTGAAGVFGVSETLQLLDLSGNTGVCSGEERCMRSMVDSFSAGDSRVMITRDTRVLREGCLCVRLPPAARSAVPRPSGASRTSSVRSAGHERKSALRVGGATKQKPSSELAEGNRELESTSPSPLSSHDCAAAAPQPPVSSQQHQEFSEDGKSITERPNGTDAATHIARSGAPQWCQNTPNISTGGFYPIAVPYFVHGGQGGGTLPAGFFPGNYGPREDAACQTDWQKRDAEEDPLPLGDLVELDENALPHCTYQDADDRQSDSEGNEEEKNYNDPLLVAHVEAHDMQVSMLREQLQQRDERLTSVAAELAGMKDLLSDLQLQQQALNANEKNRQRREELEELRPRRPDVVVVRGSQKNKVASDVADDYEHRAAPRTKLSRDVASLINQGLDKIQRQITPPATGGKAPAGATGGHSSQRSGGVGLASAVHGSPLPQPVEKNVGDTFMVDVASRLDSLGW